MTSMVVHRVRVDMTKPTTKTNNNKILKNKTWSTSYAKLGPHLKIKSFLNQKSIIPLHQCKCIHFYLSVPFSATFGIPFWKTKKNKTKKWFKSEISFTFLPHQWMAFGYSKEAVIKNIWLQGIWMMTHVRFLRIESFTKHIHIHTHKNELNQNYYNIIRFCFHFMFHCSFWRSLFLVLFLLATKLLLWYSLFLCI